MDTSNTKLATAKTIFSTAASVATTVLLARSVSRDFLPYEIQDYFSFRFRKFCNRFSSQLTMFIDEVDGLVKNQIYEAAQIYLSGKNSTSPRSLKVSKPEKEDKMNVTIGSNEEVVDIFNGVKFKWVLVCRQIESHSLYNSTIQSEVRYFELSFPKKYKDIVLSSYLPYIEKEAKSVKQESKKIKIFTVDHNNIYRNWAEAWIPANLDHPATFETLAMEAEQKKTILRDLERFVKRRDYYRKVGKAWKRGYLLYGPPGTGKSSLIAAMANYLKFDVYDLELSEVRSNSELRTLLVATANRSILVVEDIDCTVGLQDRLAAETAEDGDLQQRQVTLSGFLNFIDGLWSSCGDERIIVFTTNHKDKLDPALLRPGRMDVHVHMSYCTPPAFKVLADNYLGIQHHLLFAEIEELIRTTQVTPAEVAEQLMRSDDPELVLKGLIEFLKVKNNNIAKIVQEEPCIG
ncbi:AAA-ATPase [Melia azedarach]|uniref:AAA-ATPase n=1 Tax=Melia azedarach TaxID=155640 RepID=A0ACC1XSA2_MELAZ|nr:AAA-ATPase [Melia azedarach]